MRNTLKARFNIPVTSSPTDTALMRSSAHSQRDEQPISPELLTALTNLTLSDFSIQGNPFAIAEDTALYGPPFYTSKQGRKKAYVVFNGRRMGVFQSW